MNTPGPLEIFPESTGLQLGYMESDPEYVKMLIKFFMKEWQTNNDKYVFPKGRVCTQVVEGDDISKRDYVQVRYFNIPIAIDTEFNSYPETNESVMYAGVFTIGNPVAQPTAVISDVLVQNRRSEVHYQNAATSTISALFRTPEQLKELFTLMETCLEEDDKAENLMRLKRKLNKSWFIRDKNTVVSVNVELINYQLYNLIEKYGFVIPDAHIDPDMEFSEMKDMVKSLIDNVYEQASRMSNNKLMGLLYEFDTMPCYSRYIIYAHNMIADLPTVLNADMKPGFPHITFEDVNVLKQNKDGIYEQKDDLTVELKFGNKTFGLNQDMYKPIVTHFGRLEMRCSYQLTNKSLEAISKSFGISWLKKSHDLDYSKIRNSKTELTYDEIKYCHLDGLILCHLIANETSEISQWVKTANDKFDKTPAIYNIPYTSTGKAKRYTQASTLKSKTCGAAYKEKMRAYGCSYQEYLLGRDMCYRGGFTHASAFKAGQLLLGKDKNVLLCPSQLRRIIHVDFTSSYPAVLCMEMYPIGKPTIYETMSREDYLRETKEKLAFGYVMFRDIKLKDDAPTSYLPCDGNCNFKDPDKERETEYNLRQDNGRLVEAPYYATGLTNVDMVYAFGLYDFSELYIGSTYIYERAYLPMEFVEAILDLYYQKTQLKEASKHDPDTKRQYNALKALLNSIYGMCVKRLLRDDVIFDGESWWTEELTECEKTEVIEKANKLSKLFNNPLWGVFCTSYARRNLWLGIKAAGKDYIYCDTDSIFSYENPELLDFINSYNTEIIPIKAQRAAEGLVIQYGELDEENRKELINGILKKINAQDSNGETFTLGAWDWEADCIAFKTLGSKRYLQAYYDKKLNKVILEATVAGCPKGPLSARFQELYDGYIAEGCTVNEALERTFALFSEGLSLFPKEEYAKLSESGIHMSPNWFTYKENEKEKTRAVYLGLRDKHGKIIMSCDRDVTDYQGNTEHVTQRYGMCIVPTKFQLTIPDSYEQYIEELQGIEQHIGTIGE